MKSIIVSAFGIAFLTTFNIMAADISSAKVNQKTHPDKSSASSNAVDNVVSFNGIVSISRQGSEITRFNIGNVDDDMKTGYDIVLDKKGKELADSKNTRGVIHVKGRVAVRNNKKMLVLEEFTKK